MPETTGDLGVEEVSASLMPWHQEQKSHTSQEDLSGRLFQLPNSVLGDMGKRCQELHAPAAHR